MRCRFLQHDLTIEKYYIEEDPRFTLSYRNRSWVFEFEDGHGVEEVAEDLNGTALIMLINEFMIKFKEGDFS